MEPNDENSRNFQRILLYSFFWGCSVGYYNMIKYDRQEYKTYLAKALLNVVSGLIWIISFSILFFQILNSESDLEEESKTLKIHKYIILNFNFICIIFICSFIFFTVSFCFIFLIGRFFLDTFINYFFIEDVFYLFNYFKKKKLTLFKNVSKTNQYERYIEKNTDVISLSQPALIAIEIVNVDLNSSFVKRAASYKFTNFTKAWNLAENEVQKNKEKLNKYIATYGKENVIAAFAYSSEELPIYKIINKSVRDLQTVMGNTMKTKNDVNFWSIMPIIKSLANSFLLSPLIAHLNDLQLKASFLPENVFFYRGCSVPFAAQVGKLVCIYEYTSTSTDYQIAKQFTQNCGTLLKFTGMINGVSLGELSYYPNENEVLLYPLQFFEVTEIVQNGNTTEITLSSITRKIIKLYELLDQFFPFQLKIQNNCAFRLEKVLSKNDYYLFNCGHLRQYGYVPSTTFQSNTEQLPLCHIIGIAKRVHSNTATIKKFYLIPNIQTLIDCCKQNKKVYIKDCFVKYELDYEDPTNFDISAITLINFQNEFSNITVEDMIKHCQENDPTGVATSFVIGEGIEKHIWEQFLKNGFAEHFHNKIKVCIVKEILSSDNENSNVLKSSTDYLINTFLFPFFKKLSDLWI